MRGLFGTMQPKSRIHTSHMDDITQTLHILCGNLYKDGGVNGGDEMSIAALRHFPES